MANCADNCFDSLLSLPVQNKKCYFSVEERALVDENRLPRHIAIIPDGNRRWAKKIGASNASIGHKEGADVLLDVVKSAKELGVKIVTIYTFSTENWLRSQEEVNALMWLLENYLLEQRDEMIASGIRLQSIGDIKALPDSVQATLQETIHATQYCDCIDLVLALNYGARDELRRAFINMANDIKKDIIAIDDIDETMISSYLDTAQWIDPDLLIRTSGEERLSNFLLWQISYTEVFISKVLWPDFTPQDLLAAIISYQQRQRRGGE